MRAGLPQPSFISNPIITLPTIQNISPQSQSVAVTAQQEQWMNGYQNIVNCTVECGQGPLCVFPRHESHKGSVGRPAALLVRSGPHDLHAGQGSVLAKLFAEHLLVHLKKDASEDWENVYLIGAEPIKASALLYLWANAANVEVSGGWHS